MKLFDNINEIVRDDLAKTIRKGSKVSVAAACFSMYAYDELKKQLESGCCFVMLMIGFITIIAVI